MIDRLSMHEAHDDRYRLRTRLRGVGAEVGN